MYTASTPPGKLMSISPNAESREKHILTFYCLLGEKHAVHEKTWCTEGRGFDLQLDLNFYFVGH